MTFYLNELFAELVNNDILDQFRIFQELRYKVILSYLFLSDIWDCSYKYFQVARTRA